MLPCLWCAPDKFQRYGGHLKDQPRVIQGLSVGGDSKGEYGEPLGGILELWFRNRSNRD